MGQVSGADVFQRDFGIGDVEICPCILRDFESGDNRVGKVVLLDVVAVEIRAFDVIQRTVQEFKGFCRMVRSRGEAIDVLADRKEVGIPSCQLGESEVRPVGLRLQGHVPSVVVELPDEAGVFHKGFRGCELRGVIGSPVTTCTAESRKARGGREAGATEGKDAF